MKRILVLSLITANPLLNAHFAHAFKIMNNHNHSLFLTFDSGNEEIRLKKNKDIELSKVPSELKVVLKNRDNSTKATATFRNKELKCITENPDFTLSYDKHLGIVLQIADGRDMRTIIRIEKEIIADSLSI